MKIVFTDLDGTLLDYSTYSYKPAREALSHLHEKKIPIIICSSKTKAEIEVYREKLKIPDPFICEDGGAAYVPKGYFEFEFDHDFETKKYLAFKLGTDYQKLRKILKAMAKEGLALEGFGDMTARQVAEETGLSLDTAKLSKMRKFDEPVKILSERHEERMKEIIKRYNLHYTRGGKYLHLIGNNDKGKAAALLIDLYRRRYGKVESIGLGDSRNDFKMLDAVDRPYLVLREDHHYASKRYNRAPGIGPVGWNRIILRILAASCDRDE
ncbi:MAG: HAD-IIB family hydrolase [archaeon]